MSSVDAGAASGADRPLVSIVVPVRNGAATLDLVLRGLLEQSYSRIEVIISDNASADATPDICRRYAAHDPRVSWVRHDEVIPALENFQFCVPRAQGKYVMFAAHDDLRERGVVESLVAHAEAHPDAVCVMPSIWSFHHYATSPHDVVDARPLSWQEYPTRGKTLVRRLRYVLHNGFPVYGLLRRDTLLAYHWKDIDYGPDLPLCVWLATSGEIDVCPDVRFFYFTPAVPRDAHSRARENSLKKKLGRFPEARLAWLAALSAHQASARAGRRLPRAAAFAILYYWRRWPPIWHWVWRHTPVSLRSGWREFKRRRGWQLN